MSMYAERVPILRPTEKKHLVMLEIKLSMYRDREAKDHKYVDKLAIALLEWLLDSENDEGILTTLKADEIFQTVYGDFSILTGQLERIYDKLYDYSDFKHGVEALLRIGKVRVQV